jgi:P27 family predicted phage terminase small subunit
MIIIPQWSDTMARGRRNDHDSINSNVVSFQRLRNPIFPTLELSDTGRAYFEKLINSRERSTWTQSDVHLASQCAQIMEKIDDMQCALDREGWFIATPTGTQKAHPAARLLDQLTARQLGFLRMLGLSASQRAITCGNQAGRNAADRNAQAVKKSADDSDGILA